MANENVARNEAGDGDQRIGGQEAECLEAFAGMDSSVFRQWAMALSDVIACGPRDAAPESVPVTFGLVYHLVKAADELEARERKAMRQLKAV